jgi:glycosyltransferase involved in cell wall biosynthesis
MTNSITTIIAFYNSNTSLRIMLDSILAGSLIPNEIILIDDGSNDISVEIANEYSKNYSFIHYFRQEHCGVSAARNLGISKATSDWISFLDADDFIEPDMYCEMINAVSDSPYDGCLCGYYTHKDGIVTPYVGNLNSPLSSKKILEGMFTDDNIRGFICTRLFRTEIVKTHTFNPEIIMCEDLLFQTELFSQTNYSFAYIAKPFYHYIQNSSQSTATKNFFKNEQFIYKPAFDMIKSYIHADYVEKNYNDILEFSMFTLLTTYKKSNNKAVLKNQVKKLQRELMSTPCKNKSKRRYLYQYCPILASLILR